MIILAAPPFLVNQALVQALIFLGAHCIFSVLVQWVLTLGYEVRLGILWPAEKSGISVQACGRGILEYT